MINNIFYKFGDKQLELAKLLEAGSISFEDNIISGSKIILMEQVHSNRVMVIDEPTRSVIPGVDAIVTDRIGLYLAVKTADCIPILFYDNDQRVIAAAHAGREGVKKNIVNNVLQTLVKKFACLAENIKVMLGPAICERHYEVDAKTFADFIGTTGVQQSPYKLDLKKVVTEQLSHNKIPKLNITDIPVCTYEDPCYYSYRHSKTNKRQLSLIALL